jgi:hypothetical protein
MHCGAPHARQIRQWRKPSIGLWLAIPFLKGSGDEIKHEQPFAEFKTWLDEAWKTEPSDAHAMTLATISEDDNRRRALSSRASTIALRFCTNTGTGA